jgi:hypothetical protein
MPIEDRPMHHPEPMLLRRWTFYILASLLLTGCDPLVSLQGSFWPPWIIVMVIALPLTAMAQALFKWLGLSETLQPTLVVYPALWALITFLAWLVAFQW